MIVSASSLVRDCGYQRALRRARKPTADQQVAMDRGTAFHAAVERWARERALPVLPDMEMQGWLDLLSMEWAPPVDVEIEVAWGLSHTGEHLAVDEPQPHVYVARHAADGPLLTAGRADVAWWNEGIHVVDWKTGKWPTTPAVDNLQVNAAGIALARKRGHTSYVPGIYYARDGFWDWGPRVVFGTPAFERIWGEIRAAALLDETPRPGPCCSKCWERRGCHAAEPVGSSPASPPRSRRTPRADSKRHAHGRWCRTKKSQEVKKNFLDSRRTSGAPLSVNQEVAMHTDAGRASRRSLGGERRGLNPQPSEPQSKDISLSAEPPSAATPAPAGQPGSRGDAANRRESGEFRGLTSWEPPTGAGRVRGNPALSNPLTEMVEMFGAAFDEELLRRVEGRS